MILSYILKLIQRISISSLILILCYCNINSKKPKKEFFLNHTIYFDEGIENKQEVLSFINSIKTKDCTNFHKLIKHDYVYNVQDASYLFFFDQDNNFYLDTDKTISICDFLFEEKVYFNVIKTYEENLYNTYNVYTLTQIMQNTEEIIVHLHLDTNTKKTEMSITLYPSKEIMKYPIISMLFICESKSFSTCYLRESNTDMIHK